MGSPALMVETVPVGYRFHPTDEELVGHYLKHKLLGDDSEVQNIIAEVDVCKFEPWDLPAFSKEKSDDPEWFFFSPRSLKYPNSERANRKAKGGFWKPTGKDRNIKTRGTNNVIGTKKTLVFYKARVPSPVKTNWVIHEYHAVTFPARKRSFVLCRLMEKARKKAEGEIDALIHDEGEPSSHIVAADYETQAAADRILDVSASPEGNLESILRTPPWEAYDLPSLQESPIVTGKEPYFQDFTFHDPYLGNENSIPFETTGWEDNVDLFFNPSFIDKFDNDSTPSQSWGKACYGSSETAAKLLSAPYGNVLDAAPSACNEHTGLSEYEVGSMLKSSRETVSAGPPPLPSGNEVNRWKEDSTILGVDFIYLIQTVSETSPPRAGSSSPNYHLRSHGIAAARKSQTERKVSSKSVFQQEVQREKHVLESSKNQRKKAQGTSSRKNVGITRNQSSGVNEKGPFINPDVTIQVLMHDVMHKLKIEEAS